MGIADDISKLEALRAAGTLTDDEFRRAKERLLAADTAASPSAANKLRRSRGDRWLGGVCGGFAVMTGADAWVWRLLLVLLAVFGGTGILIYILLWIFVPSE
jgi:phage shock protein C